MHPKEYCLIDYNIMYERPKYGSPQKIYSLFNYYDNLYTLFQQTIP